MARPTDFGDWPTGPVTALTPEQLDLLGSLAISINRSVIDVELTRIAAGDRGSRKRSCLLATSVAMLVLPEFGFPQVEDLPVEMMVVDATSYEGLLSGSSDFVGKVEKTIAYAGTQFWDGHVVTLLNGDIVFGTTVAQLAKPRTPGQATATDEA